MGRRVAVTAVLVAVALLLWITFRESTQQPGSEPPPNVPSAAAPLPTADAPRARARVGEVAPATVPEAPVVPAGPTISGRVVDADGTPVAGARIVSHPDDLGKPVDVTKAGADGTRSHVATSADDGTFTIRADVAAVGTILTATADAGFGQALTSSRNPRAEIRLVRWTFLAGRVTNTANEPVAGARVTVHLLLDALTEDRTVLTDANGEYRVDRLPPTGWSPDAASVGRGRHYWVAAEAEGYACSFVESVPMGGAPRADPAKLDLVLLRGMTLTGRVVDGDTKAGIAGATVVCWSVEGMMSFGSVSGVSIANPWGPRPLGEAKSGDDGTFRFEHLPARGPSGVASHNSGKRGMTLGHVAAWKEGYVYGGDEIPVSKDGATVESVIELWPSAVVAGRVVDAGGKPVAGLSVYVGVEERRPALNGFPSFYDESRTASSVTDHVGHYRCTAFRASRIGPTRGTVSGGKAIDGQYVQTTKVEVTASAGETVEAPDLVFDSASIARATLIVTDAAGAPVAGALLERGGFNRGGRTGIDGRIAVAVPPSARAPQGAVPLQKVVVRAVGFAPQAIEFTPVTEAAVEIRVVLVPGASVSGRVLMSDGQAAAKVQIVVIDGKIPAAAALETGPLSQAMRRDSGALVRYGFATTSSDGTFVVRDLPDGPYTVAAQVASRAPAGAGFGQPPKMLRDVRNGVAAGASDLVLTIPKDDSPPVFDLDVAVTDASGAAVSGCWAQVNVANAPLRASAVDATKLRFSGVALGRWQVQVRAPGFAMTTIQGVEFGPDAPPLVVRLGRGATARGVVRAENGSLPDGVSLSLWPTDPSGSATTVVAEIAKDGTVEASGLAPGRYRVMAIDPGFADGALPFVGRGDGLLVIPEGKREIALDLVVVRSGSISATVVDARLAPPPWDGNAADEAKLKFSADTKFEVFDVAGTVVWTQSPVRANFAQGMWLAPGSYVVRLTLSGESPQDQGCEVKSDATVTMRFPRR